jgi:nitroreductase
VVAGAPARTAGDALDPAAASRSGPIAAGGRMTLEEALQSRRSIRSYTRRPLDDSVVRELIDLARHAPSSLGAEPWQFIVVRETAIKRALAAAKNAFCPPEKRDYPADFLIDAPVIVVVCVEEERAHGRGRETGVIAAAHLQLAAHARGLGSVFLTAYESQGARLSAEVARILALPSGIDPISIIPIGYPADVPSPKHLRPLGPLVHSERYRGRARAD